VLVFNKLRSCRVVSSCTPARRMSFHPQYVITSSVVRCTVAYDWAVRWRSKSWDA
jgi:hypothetical protein